MIFDEDTIDTPIFPFFEAEHEIVESLPYVVRGSSAVPEAYYRAERQFNTARVLFFEGRHEEAANAFVRVAEILSPTLAESYRGEFQQARGLAYANAAISWAASGRHADGRRRLFNVFDRDAETKLEIARAIELLADPISGR